MADEPTFTGWHPFIPSGAFDQLLHHQEQLLALCLEREILYGADRSAWPVPSHPASTVQNRESRNTMGVKARFFIQSITETTGGHEVVCKPVIRGEHNKEWSKYTPSGELRMFLTNEAGGAAAFFQSIMGTARTEAAEGRAFFPEIELLIVQAEQPEA